MQAERGLRREVLQCVVINDLRRTSVPHLGAEVVGHTEPEIGALDVRAVDAIVTSPLVADPLSRRSTRWGRSAARSSHGLARRGVCSTQERKGGSVGRSTR